MRFFLLRIYYFLFGVKTLKYYKTFFSKNLSLSRDEMVSLQNTLISNLIDHAYNHTGYYKELMDSLGLKPDDISCKEDLKKLPILSKATVRENLDKIKSDDCYGKKLVLTISSGSTGNEVVIFKSAYSIQMGYASFRRFFSLVGWNLGDRSVWLWRYPVEKGILSKLRLSLELFMQSRKIFDCICYRPADFEKFIKEIKKFKPKVIFARAGILEYFSEYLIENNIKIESVKVVISCAETLQKRDVVETAFNQPVYSLYSTRECCAMAMEVREGIMQVADDNVAMNVYDNGEFIITPLHSYGFPLINYQIGDIGAELSGEIYQDEYPFGKIDLKIGRITESFVTRDRQIIGMGSLMTEISKKRVNVNAQQFIQTDYDKFTVNYVPGKNFHKDYKQIVSECLIKYFDDDIKIQFNKLDQIPTQKNGKRLLCKRSFYVDGIPGIPKTA